MSSIMSNPVTIKEVKNDNLTNDGVTIKTYETYVVGYGYEEGVSDGMPPAYYAVHSTKISRAKIYEVAKHTKGYIVSKHHTGGTRLIEWAAVRHGDIFVVIKKKTAYTKGEVRYMVTKEGGGYNLDYKRKSNELMVGMDRPKWMNDTLSAFDIGIFLFELEAKLKDSTLETTQEDADWDMCEPEFKDSKEEDLEEWDTLSDLGISSRYPASEDNLRNTA